MIILRRVPALPALGFATGIALTFVPPPASAATLDFTGTPTGVAFVGDSFEVDGFDFENTGTDAGQHGVLIDDAFGVDGDRNITALAGASLLLTQIGGGAFTLTGFDLGGSIPDDDTNWAASVTLTATLDGGGTDIATLVLPAEGAGYTTSPLSFGPVTSIDFTPNIGGGFDFSLDNLVFDMGSPPPDPDPDPDPGSDVPLPASLPMLVGALGLLGFLRRRRAGA